MSIHSAYIPEENRWNRRWPERISQHDLVYHSPPEDPILGLPIGNGDIGALVWAESGRLMFAINKSNLWDVDSSNINVDNSKDEEGTCLRHCGRLIIDFNMPVFDIMYLNDFSGRLDLANAKCAIHAHTPFAKVDAEALISYKNKVMIIRCEIDSEDAPEIDVMFERWGSRTFSRWYSNITRDPSIALTGTELRFDEEVFLLTQKLRTMEFVAGFKIIGANTRKRRIHNRAGKFVIEGETRKSFTILFSVVSSDETDNPAEYVKTVLKNAELTEIETIIKQHQDEWKSFWDKSFISIPDKYIENLWFLNLYYANSSSRGKYPPHFCNGLWNFNRDFVPWKDYFHWNMQWYIWPLHAANHSELTIPYFEYRRAQLPKAMGYAAEITNCKGAFYADVSDATGAGHSGIKNNNTPGAQIALDFWRHYLYTKDEVFLQEKAWPVICEVSRFYANTVVKGKDGKYHIRNAQAYEGSPLMDDTITDISMIKALFPVAIKVAEYVEFEDQKEIDKWRDIERNIAGFTLVSLKENEYIITDGKPFLEGGLGKGKALHSIDVFAVGVNKPMDSTDKRNNKMVRSRYADCTKTAYYGIPDPELAPVFPSGIITLDEKGSRIFDAAVNQVYMHPDPVSDNTAEALSGRRDSCMGWCPYPIVLSRLGLSEELIKSIRAEISYWQCYCQGFGHYAPYSVFTSDNHLRWKTNRVKDNRTGEAIDFPAWPFRHFDNETIPILCTAVNEMLLQSHNGKIRLFSAVPNDWSASFRLAAAGGFIINAECEEGIVQWFSVESMCNGECVVVSPWKDKDVIYCDVYDSSGKLQTHDRCETQLSGCDRIIVFNTKSKQRYLFSTYDNLMDHWNLIEIRFSANTEYKKLGNAMLGIPRQF